jgi:hypothetical protein
MAGTIVTDRIESDASYASSVNIASPLVIANTLTMGSAASISGNVNIDSGLLFVDGVNNRVGIGGLTNPALLIEVGNPSDSNQSLRVNFPDANTAQINSTRRSGGSLQNLRIAGQETVQLLTDGTERMRVDISGRVTTPSQPTFYAWSGAADVTFSTETPLPLNSTLWNTGSHYNTSTYRFTAPVAGKYFFRANIYKQANSGVSRFRIQKNGSSYIYHILSTNAVQTEMISGIVDLAVNDYVTCTYQADVGTNIYLASDHTSFSGWFLG